MAETTKLETVAGRQARQDQPDNAASENETRGGSTESKGDRSQGRAEANETARASWWSRWLPWRRRERESDVEDEQRAPWYQRFGGRLSDLRSLITNLVTLFIVIALVVTVVREVPRNAMIIDPIEAPSALVGEGYKPTVISQRVMDEMLAIRRAATTRKEGREVSPEWQQIDIDVPGTGLSVKTILRIVRGFLGQSETRIGGEIVRDGELYRLRLRIAGFGAVAEPDSKAGDSIDELINLGARELMRAVDPYVLASYLADIDRAAALETVKHCIVNDPPDDDAWAYNLWGLLLAEAGAFEEAMEKYARAIEKAPGLALAVNNWGTALHRLEDYEAAIAKYKAALEVDPSFTSAYNNWGMALAALDDTDSAIDIYKKVIALDPDNAAAYVNWAAALAKAGDGEAALAKYRQAVLVDPDYARGFRERAKFLHERGDYSAASAGYEAAAKLAPDHAPTYVNWGRTLSKLGDLEAAEDRYRRAIQLQPDNASALNNLGVILSKRNDHAAAEQAFSRAAALDQSFAPAFDNWGIALVKREMYEAAIEKFEQALALEPDLYAHRQALVEKLRTLPTKSE